MSDLSDPDVLGLPRPLRSDIVPERTASRPSGSCSTTEDDEDDEDDDGREVVQEQPGGC